MRAIIILLVVTLALSCNKEEKRMYKMAGAYEVSQVRQVVYTNGVKSSEDSYYDVGFMEFRYPQSGAVNEDNGLFEVTNPNITIIAFQELNNNYTFNWDMSWDEERLSLVWTDFSSTYGLTFTITKNKNKTKELFFIYTETDQDGNLNEVMEFYTLELI